MATDDGTCDFAQDVAMPYPLEVILSLLGLPESDYPRMHTLTQEIFGIDDPELSRGGDSAFTEVVLDFFQYFSNVVADRQANPTDDMASVIANATIEGEPLGIVDQLSYYLVIATAGHDTTSAAISGGVKALAEHPDQFARLQADPTLIPHAVEEIIRWVTPVKSFMRNAVEACSVAGQHFEPGDAVLLSYWSANRDESIYPNPMEFDVTRTPNRHLAFGLGTHFCLGATLARKEITAILTELVRRVRTMELAGEPETSAGVFICGVKRLPLRYTWR